MTERWRVPKGPATHVLMDGGILCVPTDELEDFYSSCVEAINLGTKLYVVEQKTETFKFFVDLDYKAPEKLTESDLVQFCSIIHSSLGTSSRCLIARARPRPIAENLIKSGVHIHWPDLVVTRTQALNLRTKIILSLESDFPFDWDKVIDASVYGGSGLRMLWSHKKPTGDPYIPWRSIDGRAFSKDPDPVILKLFSIRTFDEAKTTEVLEDNEPLEGFVRSHLEGQESAIIKKVQRHEHDGWFVQTDSHYCENIKERHKSNHIWFHIGARRISQRCFDEDCREFRGQEHILPPSIVEQLSNVAVVGSPSCNFLMDFLPDGTTGALQKIPGAGARLFGARPRELAQIFEQHPRVRTVGFDPASR